MLRAHKTNQPLENNHDRSQTRMKGLSKTTATHVPNSIGSGVFSLVALNVRLSNYQVSRVTLVHRLRKRLPTPSFFRDPIVFPRPHRFSVRWNYASSASRCTFVALCPCSNSLRGKLLRCFGFIDRSADASGGLGWRLWRFSRFKSLTPFAHVAVR